MFFQYNAHNEIDWSDDLSQVLVANEIVPPPPSCTIACKACGFSPMCVQTCIGCMYYVVHSLSDLLRAAIHLGTHAHHVSEGKCNEYFKEMKIMVAKEVLCTPNSTSFVISLVVNKMFLFHRLFNEDGEVQSSHVNVRSFVFS